MNIFALYFVFSDNLNIFLKISIQITFIMFFSYFLSKIIRIILFILFKYFAKTKNIIDNSIIIALKKPIFFLIWLYAAIVSSNFIIEQLDGKLLKYTQVLKYILVYLVVLTFFIKSITQIKKHYVLQKEKINKTPDFGTIDVVEKISKSTIFVIWTVLVLSKMGFNLSALVAFGGAGGVAVGFAGKDLMANIFGGLIIYWDKPFSVGDWISSPDKSIEGDVEEIGWRQTKILTFEKYPIYVPNSLFGTIIIENKSRHKAWRIKEEIAIRFDDINKIDRISNDITKMLKEHLNISKKFRMYVNFTNFAESSLTLLVSVFTNTIDYIRYLEIKQDVLLKIAKIIKENGANFAFPTSTININKNNDILNEKIKLE